jgi:hypothetical protein
MWCKVSNKKHKNWEDDCVLVVCEGGKRLELNNMGVAL